MVRANAPKRSVDNPQDPMMGRTMEASNFIDCYEILEISPNADSETIDRMYRYLGPRPNKIIAV